MSGRRLRRLREAPGWKIDGFDETYSTLYMPGSPPLLMTHMPLREVPAGCVNVHGHLHGAPIPARGDPVTVIETADDPGRPTRVRLDRVHDTPARSSEDGFPWHPRPAGESRRRSHREHRLLRAAGGD